MTFLLAALLSVTSPLQAATNYYYTAIGPFAGLIRGVVMGEYGEYGTVRFEDHAFLHEAEFEREYLADTRYDVFTNYAGFPLGNGKTIPHKNHVFTGGFDRYLSPEDQLSTQPRVINHKVYDNGQRYDLVTNGIFVQTYQTSNYTNAFWNTVTNMSFITQEMTNGVTDVFTNIVVRQTITNVLYGTETLTNSLSYTDYCFMPRHIPFDECEDFRKYMQSLTNSHGAYHGTLVSCSNAFSIVKIARQIVPTVCTSPTNYVQRLYRFTSYDRNGEQFQGYPIEYTLYQTNTATYSVGNYLPIGGTVYTWTFSQTHSVGRDGTENTQTTKTISSDECTEDRILFTTPYSMGKDTFRRQTGVRYGKAFGFILFNVYHMIHKKCSSTGNAETQSLFYEEANVMMPCGESERTTSRSGETTYVNGYVSYDATEKKPSEIAKLAATELQLLIPDYNEYKQPDIMYPPSPQTEDGEGYTEYVFSEESIAINPVALYIVIGIIPDTVLPGWTEYE